jgi:glycosyltransferase involved in cell wall biosynthesis
MHTEETKPLCVVRAPVATRSGYGDAARDIVRHLIEYNKFDVRIHSVPWGDTPMNALDPSHPKDKMILDRVITEPLNKQPDLFIVVSVPNEFQALGKFNIGITAGIETTAASAQWVEGCNRVNLVLAMSEHSKNVLVNSKYSIQSKDGQTQGVLQVQPVVEVLHNCIDTAVFGKNAPVDKSITKVLDEIPESFAYLFVGHWLRGDYGEDRKNVALLVKLFLETFKQVKDRPQPALILKTSSAGFSILDREEIRTKIEQLKASVTLAPGQSMPNVYLLHGELTEQEMNTLYNHSKVKAHISLTKGEGFGRPLLEASVSGKPVIASGWSGQLDFLDKDRAVLVGGELKNVHPSAAWENVLLTDASWFAPDHQQAVDAMAVVFMDYKTFKDRAYSLAVKNRKDFSYNAIRDRMFALLDQHVPEFPKEVAIKLPTLKKIELPKLTKVD